MALETDGRIETGRSWRDLPDAPPESDAIGPVDPATVASATTITQDELDTVPLPSDRVAAPAATPATTSRKWWPWAISALSVAALVALLFIWSPWAGDAGEDVDAGTALVPGAEPIADVAASLLPSVVQIEQDGVFGAVGSGFVYHEGRVLTAAHVVAGAQQVTVRTSTGEELVGTVLGGDPVADIAVVAIDSDIPAAPLATGETAQVGQLAVAIGSPLGFEQSVTSGIVSAVDRELPIGGTVLGGLIQTDAPINQGNSGGPLADRNGRVIGVNVAIATASGGSDGLGFAVGIDKAVEIAERFTSSNPQPDSLEGGGGLFDPGLLPPEFQDFLDDLLGGGGQPPLLGEDDLNGLLDEFFGGQGDLDGLLDDFLSGNGDLDGLLDDLLGGNGDLDGLLDDFGLFFDDGSGGALQPGLLEYLLQLLLGGNGELTPEDLNNLFDQFQGEG